MNLSGHIFASFKVEIRIAERGLTEKFTQRRGGTSEILKFLKGNNNHCGFAAQRNGLRSLPQCEIDDLAQTALRFLQLPGRVLGLYIGSRHTVLLPCLVRLDIFISYTIWQLRSAIPFFSHGSLGYLGSHQNHVIQEVKKRDE